MKDLEGIVIRYYIIGISILKKTKVDIDSGQVTTYSVLGINLYKKLSTKI